MKPAVSTLTISFEAPFWVGLYEREEEGLYQVCKIPFGAEPKDYEVYAFLQRHWKDLTFSPPLPAGTVPRARINPKRLQREIRKQLQTPAIGTKAQQVPAAAARPAGPDPEGDRPSKANPGPAPPGRPCAGRNTGKNTGAIEADRPAESETRRAIRRLPNEHGPAGEQRGCSKASPFASSEY
ncbi:MAG: YjdF family protein [Evtepia gabavorous]